MADAGTERVFDVAVIGAGGRMGRELCAAVESDPRVRLCARITRDSLPDLEQIRPDAVLEFTGASSIPTIAQHLRGLETCWLSGTTGLGTAEQEALREAAVSLPVLWAPNTSLGIGWLRRWLREGARSLGPDWSLEIVETHHSGKRDAPSGTALSLAQVWAAERGGAVVHGREATAGSRNPSDIGVHALRLPGVIGEHRLVLSDGVESLELQHRAESRTAFVRGAIEGLVWLRQQEAGLYGLDEWVLGRLEREV